MWLSKEIRMFVAFLAAILLVACSEEDGEKSSSGVTETYKVLMIVPSTQQKICDRTTAWALDNITKAQLGLRRKVKLELTWKNEYDEDLADYVREVCDDPSIVAIIGPTESGYAKVVAPICLEDNEKLKTLILPVATSTELQRIYAGSELVWNLAQSDITQCEILLTQAKLSEVKRVQLITSNDDYGKSFGDWFSYQAIELGLEVDNVTMYKNESELSAAIMAQADVEDMSDKAIIFAPSKESDAVCFDKTIGEMKAASKNGSFEFPLVLCSDIMSTASLGDKLTNMQYEGIAPTANPETGFISAYKTKFGEEPVNGEAHIFDALMLTAYALTAKTEQDSTLSVTIKRIVDGRESAGCSWMPSDMHNSFEMLRNGQLPDLEGVTGDWTFDEKNHASVLNTTYNHWILSDGKYKTIEYLSTDGSGRTTSTLQSWDWQTSMTQTFSESQKDITYPDLADNWAVVVATSDTWVNYRHQADALAMYQLLKRHGYDDDHIILVMENNIAYNENNLYPGEVRVRTDGENLYHDVNVDYHLSDINIDDLHEIMMGNSSTRLPHVISPTANDNVIVFWCGHGEENQLMWGDNSISASSVRNILEDMSNAGKFRKIMFAIDACYSGSIGEACKGIPGVIFVSAANANESSKADMKDKKMGIWLSNGFTRAFQEQIDEDPTISLRDLYYVLARRTVGSHATIYNAENYGNLYHNTMEEYLGK